MSMILNVIHAIFIKLYFGIIDNILFPFQRVTRMSCVTLSTGPGTDLELVNMFPRTLTLNSAPSLTTLSPSWVLTESSGCTTAGLTGTTVSN